MQKGFYVRQREGVDGTRECDLIRTDISSIKELGSFSFIKNKFDYYQNTYPYLKLEPLKEQDQYLVLFHHNHEFYPLATLRDYGGNIDDRLWFNFLVHGKTFKILYGDLYYD